MGMIFIHRLQTEYAPLAASLGSTDSPLLTPKANVQATRCTWCDFSIDRHPFVWGQQLFQYIKKS